MITRRQRTLVTAVLIGGCSLLLTGCGKYYRVTDRQSGQSYYTRLVSVDQDMTRPDGSLNVVRFRSAKTMNMMALPDAFVETISKEQFDAATKSPDS